MFLATTLKTNYRKLGNFLNFFSLTSLLAIENLQNHFILNVCLFLISLFGKILPIKTKAD